MGLYTTEQVENMLRGYMVLRENDMVDYADLKMDIDMGLKRLKEDTPNTYGTIVGVFVFGNSIIMQAKQDNISKMQVHRRLDSGLQYVTNIMNGVFA
jgi:hypothetical protein